MTDTNDTAIGSETEKSSAGRIAIVVLGMHRSGTSALTRMLNLLGAHLPEHLIGADATNKAGHWEPQLLVSLHDRMLAEAGSRWHDWRTFDERALPPGRLDHYRNEIARIIAEDYNDAPLIVLKDPRICRFVPLYEQVLAVLGIERRYVLVQRNPLGVMASLAARDSMTPAYAGLLWLRHILDGEAATRGSPRALVSYEAFLEDWRTTASHLSRSLSVVWPRSSENAASDIENHLSRDLQHHAPTLKELDLDPNVTNWIKEAYHARLKLTVGENEPDALAKLDHIKDEFDKASGLFGTAAIPELIAREEQLFHANQHIATGTGEIEEMKDELATRDKKITRLSIKIKEKNSALKVLNDELVQLRRLFEENISSNSDAIKRLEIANEQIKGAQREKLEEREKKISELLKKIEMMEIDRKTFISSFEEIHNKLLIERTTVLRPLYRNVYRIGGRVLRGTLADRYVAKLRSIVPNPDGVPKHLSYQPVLGDKQQENHFQSVCAPQSQPDVFVFSIINWDFRYQRPQHITKELSRQHRVFYIEMDMNSTGFSVRKLDPNLYVVRLPVETTGNIQPYNGRPSVFQVKQWIDTFYKLCDAVDATSFKHIIIQHPFWWQLARNLPPEFNIIFDCMDDIGGFSNTEPFLLELERDMIRKADHLVVSSQYLFDKYKDLNSPHMIRNGGEIDHFIARESRGVPDFLAERGFERSSDKIRVGYVGAIAEWFDAELIAEVAQKEQGFEFHLCGSVTAKEPAQLDALSNVTMYGEIPYADVPAFLNEMDVLIIPFRILPIIQACDPVKFYEYSSMGKPTVATALPELERAAELVFFATTAEEFAAQVRIAMSKAKDGHFRSALKAYAAQNTWEHRAQDFEAVLSDFPKVSIIILAYGDPQLAEATLHSLYDRGAHYPNLEVIIIDNGSSDEDLDQLRRCASEYPNVRIIENGVNLGFAKGNNVGIEASSGEYIVLLNNDTYVAPGAIHSMVRHLEQNPSIGAVGPLTNNIGNEAKLFAEYSNMEEMKRVAREATTGYRGRFTSIRVLAYFAVMFRKRDLEVFGKLSNEYGLGMFEDDDHSAVIRSHGYVCALAEDAFVHHHLSAAFSSSMKDDEKKELFERNKAIFEKKWGKWIPHTYRHDRPPNSIDVEI